MTREQLIKEAIKARKNSYSIYSKFAVGAAVLTKDNKVFYGVNIENASFGLTVCAERNAIFAAYSNGYRKDDIKAVAIVAKDKEIAYPCGACRQVLAELISKTTPIYLSNLNGKVVTTNISKLLPHEFASKDFK